MSLPNVQLQHAAIAQYAQQLRLLTIGDQFAALAEQAVKEKRGHLSYLEALLGLEVEERQRQRVTRRILEAHFPKVKTLEEFQFEQAPQVPAALLRNLAEGGYLERSEPVIFLGEAGTGKTHLATGLAVAACQQQQESHAGNNGEEALTVTTASCCHPTPYIRMGAEPVPMLDRGCARIAATACANTAGSFHPGATPGRCRLRSQPSPSIRNCAVLTSGSASPAMIA